MMSLPRLALPRLALSRLRVPALGLDGRTAAAMLAYLALAILLASLAAGAVSEALEQQAALETAREHLDRLEGRRPPPGGSDQPAGGSPFLEGPSVTVAGAALVQRLARAVEGRDARILSAGVELEGEPFGPGFVAVAASLEIAQPDLQKLLYDLEAGMPFLFVDQIMIQAPQAAGDQPAGHLRVQLKVYGRWRGAP